MYLKSLDIAGFKSFADKTRIELKPGIAGIVGPNGCGKSNVTEAVRWCIGEMSWKSLRSPSMVDVIFNGNSKRSPLGMAEVHLTFDNASRQLPIDYSEITVTRRIFRSGESEYLLNKTPCRLRDIKELFLDTGIGGDGYAIIDQGGVDFVLNSKPQDRRCLFEEAAGVAKYRARREEALRKLERVEADLARLKDSVALIDEQIKKLESDARKAKSYQKAKEDLSALEIGQALREIARAAAELEQGGERLAPVRESLRSRRLELDAEEARLAALRLELAERDAAKAECDRKIAAVKAEIARLEERVQHIQRAALDHADRRSQARDEAEQGRLRLEGLGPEVDGARGAVEQAGRALELARLEREDFRGRREALDRQVRELESALEGTRRDVLAAAQAVLEAHNAAAGQEKALGALGYDLRRTLQELGRSERHLAEARREADRAMAESWNQGQWAADLRRSEAQKRAERDALHGDILRATQDMLRARSECSDASVRIETWEARGGQDPYWVGAHQVLAADIPGVLGTLRSLIQVDSGFEPYVEDALGERLYAVVCEELSSAERAIEHLEAGGKGRARFLVLSAMPDSAPGACPPQARPLLEHVRWDTRIEPAARALLAESYALGRRAYGRHWISGGASGGELESLKFADLAALREQAGRALERQAESERRKTVLQERAAEAEEGLRRASEAAREQDDRTGRAAAQWKQGAERAQALERDIRLLTEEAARLLRECAAFKEDWGGSRRSWQDAGRREASLREAEGALIERLSARRAEAASGEQHAAALDGAVRQAQAQFQLIEGQHRRLVLEEEGLKSAVEKRRSELEAIDLRLEECARIESESKAGREACGLELAERETAARAMAERTAELAQSSRVLEARLKDVRAACEELQQELHRWEVTAGALESRRDSQKAKLQEGWQLSWEEAFSRYGEIEPDPERIQALQRRIQNMGNINMAAPEEYEALSGRHGFLLAQIDDLNKAKDDLRAAIAKINGTTREHFRQTFSEVREHFQRIYAALFEGGEADLVLTDQENLLETGVEIVAQPPGKRLQSITLLSGGEKTLTAIALLFSFFMVRPSPLCMLDEADAALDEANIDRFKAMLREFASKSQFLIISHNKRTLEAADVVFGVTMEESGVSRILSVDFKKRAPHASEDFSQAVSAAPGGAVEGGSAPPE